VESVPVVPTIQIRLAPLATAQADALSGDRRGDCSSRAACCGGRRGA